MSLPHPRVKVNIVGSLRDREVACSASDRQGSNFESCVWRTVSSQSSHHPQEVLLVQFSLYVHKGGLKPDSFLISHTPNRSHPVHVLPSLLLIALPHSSHPVHILKSLLLVAPPHSSHPVHLLNISCCFNIILYQIIWSYLSLRSLDHHYCCQYLAFINVTMSGRIYCEYLLLLSHASTL